MLYGQGVRGGVDAWMMRWRLGLVRRGRPVLLEEARRAGLLLKMRRWRALLSVKRVMLFGAGQQALATGPLDEVDDHNNNH